MGPKGIWACFGGCRYGKSRKKNVLSNSADAEFRRSPVDCHRLRAPLVLGMDGFLEHEVLFGSFRIRRGQGIGMAMEHFRNSYGLHFARPVFRKSEEGCAGP